MKVLLFYQNTSLHVTGSWDEDSSYASWTRVSSETGLVLCGLIGSRTVIVGLMYAFVFHSLMDWHSDTVVLIHHRALIVA